MKLFEIHEQDWLPASLRRGVTDVLQFLLNRAQYARVVAPLLKGALERSGARHVIDLCAGSGGPWPQLLALLQGDLDSLCLTDKFPYPPSAQRFGSGDRTKVSYFRVRVDAENVPETLKGFRTIFNSFHHFDPARAENILRDAAARQEGIAVFELPGRNAGTILATCLGVLATFLLVPLVRPLRPGLLFWTYAVPAIPAILLLDGIVSCLRAYTADEMRQLAESAAPGYDWESGIKPSGLARITYLIGFPKTLLARADSCQR